MSLTSLVLRVLDESAESLLVHCMLVKPRQELAWTRFHASLSSRVAPRSPRLDVFHGPTPRVVGKLDTLNHT